MRGSFRDINPSVTSDCFSSGSVIGAPVALDKREGSVKGKLLLGGVFASLRSPERFALDTAFALIEGHPHFGYLERKQGWALRPYTQPDYESARLRGFERRESF